MIAHIDEAINQGLTLALRIYREGGLTEEAFSAAIAAGLGAVTSLLPTTVSLPGTSITMSLDTVIEIARPMLAAALKAVIEATKPGKVVVSTEAGVKVTGRIE